MSETLWVARATYVPDEYVVIPDGDLSWIELSPKYSKADADLAAGRLNAGRVTADEMYSALVKLERHTPTTTIQVIDTISKE